MDKHRSIRWESLSQPPSAVSMCRGSAVEVAVSLEVSLEAATVEAAETATGPSTTCTTGTVPLGPLEPSASHTCHALGSGSSSWALSGSAWLTKMAVEIPHALYKDTLILFHCYLFVHQSVLQKIMPQEIE